VAVNIHRPGSRALLHIRQPIVLISSRRDRRIRRRGSLDVHSSYFLGRKFYRAAPIFEVKARSDQEPIVARNEKGDGNSQDRALCAKPEIAAPRRASPKACAPCGWFAATELFCNSAPGRSGLSLGAPIAVRATEPSQPARHTGGHGGRDRRDTCR